MNKKILRLAVPNILSNITVPLLSSVDTAVMGHLDSPVYLGAIALGSMIFNFIYWGFGFLRMGTTGLTAQAFGAENKPEVSSILYRSILISVISGLLLVVLQYPIAELSFYLIEGSKEVEINAALYFNIRVFAAPATLALYSLHGWFLGVQNAKYPLVIALFINSLNIILNFLFVYQFNMKVEGVALATLIAQYTGLLFAIWLLLKKYKPLVRKIIIPKIIEKEKLIKFLQVNTDILLRTLLLIFTLSFFTAKSAEIDNTTLAANFILLQLWLIISYGVDGFAFAAESLVGKYVGSRSRRNVFLTIKFSFIWGLGLGGFLSFIYFLFDRDILSIYTSQKDVIETSMVFMFWIVISPVINSVSFIWDGIYFGATATREMLYSMIISTIIFFLPIYYIAEPKLGNHAIWFSLTAFMIIRGLTLTLYFKAKLLKTIKQFP